MKRLPKQIYVVQWTADDGEARGFGFATREALESLSVPDLSRRLNGSGNSVHKITLTDKFGDLRPGTPNELERVTGEILLARYRRCMHLTRPPGSLMQSVAEFLFSRKSYEQVAKPIVADMQFEYFLALHEGRRAKAAWIRVRSSFSFWFALGMVRIFKTAVDLWRRVKAI